VNFRKDRVSKAAAFACLALVLSLLAPTRPAPPSIAADRDTPAVGSLAYAQPPRLAHNCAGAHAELRFEMIPEDRQAPPPPARSPVVCLAVHSPPERASAD
jgi:hypothetical protein